MRRGVVALALAGIVAGALAATPAWAAPTTEVIQGRVLRLVSVADWEAATRLLPGQPVRWDVAVSADAPDPGSITLGVSARGDAPLLLDVELCMREWQDAECPGGAETLESGWSVPRDGSEIVLADFAATDTAHLRLWVALAADEPGVTDVRVHASGVGDAVEVGPDGGLAATGGEAMPWAIGAGVGLGAVALGVLAMRVSRRGGGSDA